MCEGRKEGEKKEKWQEESEKSDEKRQKQNKDKRREVSVKTRLTFFVSVHLKTRGNVKVTGLILNPKLWREGLKVRIIKFVFLANPTEYRTKKEPSEHYKTHSQRWMTRHRIDVQHL